MTELQPPLVDRKNMSGGLLTKLAKFVALHFLKTLCGRKDLDQQSVSAINKAIESRDDKAGNRVAMAEFRGPSLDSETSTDATAEARVRQLFAEGSLTDDVDTTALDGRIFCALCDGSAAAVGGYPADKDRQCPRRRLLRPQHLGNAKIAVAVRLKSRSPSPRQTVHGAAIAAKVPIANKD